MFKEAHPSFDIWSLGITLYALMARKEPYIEESVEALMIAIFAKERDPLSSMYSKSLRDLVDKCLNTDPGSRPNIEQVLRYPLVRAELDNIWKDFDSLKRLTKNEQTASSSNLVLERVVEIQSMLAESTDDYWFAKTD